MVNTSSYFTAPEPYNAPVPFANLRVSTELQYRSPKFQRRYEWKREERNDFWSDVMESMDSGYPATQDEAEFRRIFMGALVFHDEPSRRDVRLVIDGQQRLLTINLLVCAAHKIANQNNWVEIKEMCWKILMINPYNQVPFKRWVPTYFDNAQYDFCLQDSGIISYFEGTVKGRVKDTYFEFYDRLKKEFDTRITPEESKTWLQILIGEVIENCLFFSPISIVGSHHAVTEVFDRINRKGQPLTLMDLIRNEVFRRFGPEVSSERAEITWKTHWKPFEQQLGNATTASDFFFPYALIQKSSTTQNKAFRDLRSYWEGLISDSTPTENQQGEFIQDPQSDAETYAELVLADMQIYVPAFLAISKGGDHINHFPELKEELKSLLRMDPLTRTSYSFLMRVLTEYKKERLSPEFTRKALRLVDSFLVRMAFASREPTGLHAVFKSAFSTGDVKSQNLNKLVEDGLTSRTIPFPDDETFKENVSEFNLYDSRMCNYVILEYERAMRNDVQVVDDISDKNIDHIMPASLTSEWITIFDGDSHSFWKDKWANLVPLTGRMNKLKNTRSFVDAKEILNNETTFVTAKNIYDNYERWTEVELKQRTEELAEWAVGRWPRDTLLD